MQLNRRDIGSNVKIVLNAISEVKTVVRTNASIDISNYYSTDLPLIEIMEAEESPDAELTAKRQMSLLNLRLRVYFLEWGEFPNSTYETLIKKIRNAIGNNFNLNDTANGAWVVGVGEIQGTMPLYYLDIRVRIKFYLDLEAT